MYDAASDGQNPLVDEWDESEYEMLAGTDSLAVDHFRSLNTLWVESGMAHRIIDFVKIQSTNDIP